MVNRGEATARRKIVFSLQAEVPFGHSVVVSGNLPCLGNWQLDTAAKLSYGMRSHGCSP